MSDQRKNARIKLDELMYYFDGQEKDAIDTGKLARKVGQVLTLRSKLLSLPQEEFDQAIAAIERLITTKPNEQAPSKDVRPQRQREAMELFDKTKNGNGAVTRSQQVTKV
jgi:hypothetical protein